ncbi:MAG: hypothetical protein J6X75_01755 [Clostridia bacterium]|nr:hypothetical protein [Clostridia bacterium]
MGEQTAILEIGSSKVTVLVGRKGTGGSIVVDASSECRYAGFLDGKWVDVPSLSSAIGQALSEVESKARIKINSITVGVPGQFTVTQCKEVSVNFDRKHKLTADDVTELHDSFPLPSDPSLILIHSQPVYYFTENERKMIEPVGVSARKLGGVISCMFALKSFTDTIDSILKGLGIEEYEYISSLLAESLLVIPDSVRDRYAIIIDVGYLVTDVAFVRGDGLLRQFSFSLGGGHITNEIRMRNSIRYSYAESLKRKIVYNLEFGDRDDYEITVAGQKKGFAAKGINANAEKIVDKIIRVIKKNLELHDYPKNTKFYLTGGGVALNQGARNYFARRLAENIEIAVPPIPQYERPDLSSPLGVLAMVLA